MNSIEIAKKLIEENKRDIEDYRTYETEQRKLVEETEKELKKAKAMVELLEARLKNRCEELERIRDTKKEYLVDNLALQAFIANGGGLDMLD